MRSADLRRAELRVARLRGFPLPTLLAVSITEPAALCAIGVVLGILGAWGVVLLAASILFTPGTTVGLDMWTFVGFGTVVLTICAVLGLSSLRLLRGYGLAGSSRPSGGSRSRLAIDVSILAISVVAVVGAATSGALSSHGNPVAAAAPAVIALGTSVIAIRIVEYLCRRLSVATLDSSAVPFFLAVRQIGRRPTALREGRTLVIAVALACFAVSAWSVARSNRLTAATFSIGARTVVTVTPAGRSLDQAVDAVDPRGRFAMAAMQVSGPGTPLIGSRFHPPGCRRGLARRDNQGERRRGQPRSDLESGRRGQPSQRRAGGFGRRVVLGGGEPGAGAHPPHGLALRSGGRDLHRRPRQVARRPLHLSGRRAEELPLPPGRPGGAAQYQPTAELRSDPPRCQRTHLQLRQRAPLLSSPGRIGARA